jgi:hypothetical protein
LYAEKDFLPAFSRKNFHGGNLVEIFHILYPKSPKFYQKEATPEGVASVLKFKILRRIEFFSIMR